MPTADDLFHQALVAHQLGDTDAAERGYRQILTLAPDHGPSLTNLASLVARRGETAEAESLYLRAISANPAHGDAHFNLGNLYRRLSRFPEAIAAYEEVLRIAPGTAAALVNIGLACGDSGLWPRAVECFARAATVAPHLPDVLDWLGAALAHCGRREEALAACRESVSRFPESARGHYNLGLHLAAAAMEDAILTFERALALNPNYPEAHNALGAALDAVGRADDAQREYREAIRLRPAFADALGNLGAALGEQGRSAEAIEALRRAPALAPNPAMHEALLANLRFCADLTAEQLRDEHIAWAETYANSLLPLDPPHRRANRAEGRLRLGYVFGGFPTRATAAFLEALFTHHDRQQFHVTAYASPMRPDDSLDRLRRLADTWKVIGQLTDAQLAEAIRADEIDILIDATGHIPGNRLLAFARKPAATQISLFGSPATTGLRTMDYRVTDAVTDPPDQTDALFVEKLLRLPDFGWLYVPPGDAPPPNTLPATSARVFTFGCLNHPGKLSEPCVDAWAALLKAVPKSRLVLLAGQSVTASEALAARFTGRGIASDRLELVYRLPASEYMGMYQPLDLALDPFPYGGAVTTCDALWMGVPVLTVVGRDARGRQGVSILNALGLPEFVADTPEQSVSLAATWAEQRESLAELRGTLREMMRQSPVTAAANYVKQLEAAYRSI